MRCMHNLSNLETIGSLAHGVNTLFDVLLMKFPQRKPESSSFSFCTTTDLAVNSTVAVTDGTKTELTLTPFFYVH